MSTVKFMDRILLTSALSFSLAGGLFACQGSVPNLATGSTSSTTSTTTSSTSTQANTGFMGGGPGGRPGGQNIGTSVVSGSTTYNPELAASTSCAGSGINQIICLADALKASLNASQLATLQRTYSVGEAKRWSNLPQQLMGGSTRVGLNFGEMTTEQIQAAKALLKAMTSTQSNEGWEEVQQILNADEYLQANGAGSVYGAQNYYLAFLGTPATTGTFEIQFGGHHLAIANTYKDGTLAGATPSFRGLEPFAAFSWNGVNNQPLQQEKDSLQAILASFSSAQLATAKINGSFGDVVVGPQKDGQFPTSPSGIKVSELSEAQKNLIITAIKTYVDDIAGTEFLLQKYISELDQTYISYTGNTDLASHGDYIRIDGPSVWIEYSCQNGVIYQAAHPHSVWRDKQLDYGGNS